MNAHSAVTTSDEEYLPSKITDGSVSLSGELTYRAKIYREQKRHSRQSKEIPQKTDMSKLDSKSWKVSFPLRKACMKKQK